MKLKLTSCSDRGLVCDSCQESFDRCAKCRGMIFEGNPIYCEHHSQTDCVHYHKGCADDKFRCEMCGDENDSVEACLRYGCWLYGLSKKEDRARAMSQFAEEHHAKTGQ